MMGELTFYPTNVSACPSRDASGELHPIDTIRLMLRRGREEFLDVILTPGMARQVIASLQGELSELSNPEPAPF